MSAPARRTPLAALRRRWLLAEAGGVLLCALAGAGVLALAAGLDGRPVVSLAWLGLLLGAAEGVLDTRWRAGPARAVEPASDPRGFWRTVLTLAEDHPLALRLQSRSPSSLPRFRASADWRGLCLLGALLAGILLWQGSAPVMGPRAAAEEGGGAGPRTAASSTGAAANATGDSRPEGVQAPVNRARGNNGHLPQAPESGTPAGGRDGAAGEPEPVPLEPLAGVFIPGEDLRRFEGVVDRFLRLQARRVQR